MEIVESAVLDDVNVGDAVVVGIEVLAVVEAAVVSLLTGLVVAEIVGVLVPEVVDIGKVVDPVVVDKIIVAVPGLGGVVVLLEEPVELGSVIAVVELAVSLAMDAVVL